MKAISASILSADFRRLEDEIIKVQEAGVDYIHIDVMDGVFVPNITIGPMIVKAVKKVAEIPLDVHLMIVNPDRFIDTFVDSGSDILTVHAEASVHLHRTITYIKGKGIKAGVSLNPTTSLDLLEYILDELFMVVVMTVNPGFEAQPFIPSMLRKIERLRKMIDSRGLDTKIEVDGGIGIGNIREVADAGADIFVTGSSLFYSQDYRETVRAMKAKISSKD